MVGTVLIDNNPLRRRVRELEKSGDIRALHSLLSNWPWPENERPDSELALVDLERRIADYYEAKRSLPSRHSEPNE
jgi:hypothetical protein